MSSELRAATKRALDVARQHQGRADDCGALARLVIAALAAEQPARTTERHIALREAHEIAAERDYFNARPHITNDGPATMLFEAGFRRGFDAGAKAYAEQPQPDAMERDAVDALIEGGWTWDGDQWQRPAPAEQPQPVAVVTECEACFTPDVCQLRGTCDHYSAEWLRVAPPPPAAEQPQPVAWIACDQRMPEAGDEVLVWLAAPVIKGGSQIALDTWDEQHEAPVSWSSATIPVGMGWDSGTDWERITHWMPLPAAPGVAPPPAAPQAEAPSQFARGIDAAARFVEKRLADYDAEHGSTDPDTGTREYPGTGDEYACELAEIAEAIRALAPPPAAAPSFDEWYDSAHWGNEDFREGCRRAWEAALAARERR